MSTMNYRRCSKCGKTRAEDLSVTYHRFPQPGTTNILKARAWATYCWPNEDWTYEALCSLHNKTKVLCGRHFSQSQFYDNKRQKLSKFAVPDSPEVEQLLNTRENIYDPNTEQSNTKGNVFKRSSQPFQDIKNVIVHHPSTSCSMIIPTNIFVSQSESTHIEQNSHSTRGQPQLIKLSQIEVQCSARAVAAAAGSMPEQTVTQAPTSTESSQQLNQNTKKQNRNKKQTKILETLGINKIQEMTPREKRLYKLCRNKMRQIIKLKNDIKNKKGSLRKVLSNKYVNDLCDLKISNSFVTLLQSQLLNCPRKPKGRRYTLQQKIQALVIYKKSPACYRLLRRMFALPCQTSLNQLLNKVPLKPGINEHIFSALKKQSADNDEENNICILSFDEMCIRKHLAYNQKIDEIQGYQDHGNHGRTHEIASKALVFMLAGIREKWKQPIAFYFSHTIKADRMTVILREILTQCFAANMNVVATVCDLSTVNVKVLKTLGVTATKPYFNLCEKEIVTIYDPPHLLKCTRNLLMKHDIEVTSDLQCNDKPIRGTVKWSHIEAFYELDKNNPNLVYAPQLTDRHLHPNCHQQMRVNLAAQVFSFTVTMGILMKIAQNQLPAEAHATAGFLLKFDELFDAVNADSKDCRRGKKYSTNLTKKTSHLNLFREMRKLILNMKYIGSKSNPPSQEGWVHTLNAIERLWKNLTVLGINSLATRNLNQDVLENCFGCIRYSCGSNNNPTVPQFIAGIKTAIVSNLKYSGRKRNCELDTNLVSNNFSSFLNANISPDLSSSIFKFDDDGLLESLLSDAVEAVELGSSEGQACGYVCGFIFKKLRNNSCPNCRKVFLSDNQEPIHVFTNLKEYDLNINCLNYVSIEMVTCVETMANIIHHYLKVNAYKNDLKINMLQVLECVDLGFLTKCSEHFKINENHLKISTFFIMTKRFVTLMNRHMDDEEKKKALERKIKILRHM